jgi:glycosyltransferase involved in cell wall biosynthesis
MRILYVITRSHPGGAQSHVLELIRGLRGANDIGVVAGEDGFLCTEASKLGADIFVAPGLERSITLYRDVLAAVRVRRIVDRFSPDVVHAHCSKAGLIGRFAARMSNVPSVYTAHGWRFAPGAARAERLMAWPAEWFGARLGQHLITVSACDFNLATRFRIAHAGQVTLIHNGISNCQWRSRNSGQQDVKMVMVARFAPPKDQVMVMRALQGLPGHVRLALVGDGPTLKQAQTKAIDLGINDRVTFLGCRADVADILAESDLFVLSSTSEGLPISILEALRAGLPVVTTDVGGVRDCVYDGANGLVVPRGDVGALRAAIAAIADSPSLRVRMGKAGRGSTSNSSPPNKRSCGRTKYIRLSCARPRNLRPSHSAIPSPRRNAATPCSKRQ